GLADTSRLRQSEAPGFVALPLDAFGRDRHRARAVEDTEITREHVGAPSHFEVIRSQMGASRRGVIRDMLVRAPSQVRLNAKNTAMTIDRMTCPAGRP